MVALHYREHQFQPGILLPSPIVPSRIVQQDAPHPSVFVHISVVYNDVFQFIWLLKNYLLRQLILVATRLLP
jgi:hypothetical protein